jgi:hypothetical protein
LKFKLSEQEELVLKLQIIKKKRRRKSLPMLDFLKGANLNYNPLDDQLILENPIPKCNIPIVTNLIRRNNSLHKINLKEQRYSTKQLLKSRGLDNINYS